MSVLLVGAAGELAEVLIARLVEQGDEVRVVEDDDGRGSKWRALGAYVARGTPDDFDLIERAAQNVRTLVVLGRPDLGPILSGATAASVERIVCAGARSESDVAALGEAKLDYVILETPGRSRWRRGSGVSSGAIAEAIDAADDLAGHPRLVLDLGDTGAWPALGLAPPQENG